MRKVPQILLAVIASLLVAVAAGADKNAEVLAIGAKGPDFGLLGTDGERHKLADYVEAAKATVVVFTCNSCPWAQAYEPVLIDLAKQYAEKPVAFLLINPNSVDKKPTDSYEHMVERAKEKEYPFNYLHDDTQEIARAYGAQRTPEVFVLDSEQVCRYSGRINDNAKPEQVKVHDLSLAIDALLSGNEVPVTTTKAFGCTIKWKQEKSKKKSS